MRLAESETAALGAALQAAAAVHGTTADEAARAFAPKAAAEDRSEPDPDDASVYADLRARFEATVRELSWE